MKDQENSKKNLEQSGLQTPDSGAWLHVLFGAADECSNTSINFAKA
jgi:hypothetical protein